MKKILIVSTVSRQFYLFEQGNIDVLKSLGYEVHVAANFNDYNERLNSLDVIMHPFDIDRSPFSLSNIKAYNQLKKIMKSESFDVVHCHSPMGGVLGRLAAKSCGVANIIYTAHGFHFYKGAPLLNWLIYYPIEKMLSKITNLLITINKEDNERARKMCNKKVTYIPGIGVDVDRFKNVSINKDNKMEEVEIPPGSFTLLSVGELNANKNHEVVIKALAKLNSQNVYYIICGKGIKEKYLKELAMNLGVEKKVKFLGFRNDLEELYSISDIFVFPSFREGLSVSLMEAMSAGLPIICSSVRGNTDLVQDEIGGMLFNPKNIDELRNQIEKLKNDTVLREKMGNVNLNLIEKYDKNEIKKMMYKTYTSFE